MRVNRTWSLKSYLVSSFKYFLESCSNFWNVQESLLSFSRFYFGNSNISKCYINYLRNFLEL
jgi:hypothetical protein